MSSELNRNIKNFRTFKSITQEELANRVGKSKNVISNWERGDNSPDVDSIEKICAALGVTPNQLFGWEPYPEYEKYVNIMRKKRQELDNLEDQKAFIQKQIDTLRSNIRIEEEKWRNQV